ncbi:DUF2062 domain-containing protein [Plasmodiophora brassicae]|uniref:DUF2062 domain-containing protein n=1 Tax=Plasmodiophora brassicae TaxID=37360 RepID=A0A0G4J4W4_PLABS|nr:hypothetical protein PBRA_008905 [Plasmodiophora brassicae]SPQ93750.1 unnamed protein product [Plasmodiophora brassicae]
MLKGAWERFSAARTRQRADGAHRIRDLPSRGGLRSKFGGRNALRAIGARRPPITNAATAPRCMASVLPMSTSAKVDAGQRAGMWDRLASAAHSAKEAALAVLRQEITPETLTASVALGFMIGVCPLVGVTFVIVAIVGIVFRRLNMAAMQLVNAVTTPVELAMLVPYLRLGEYLLGSDMPLALSPAVITESLRESLLGTLTKYSHGLMIATCAWLVTLPVAAGILYVVLLPPIRWLHQRHTKRQV